MLCHDVTTVDFSVKKVLVGFSSASAETVSETAVDGYLTTEGVACLYLMLSGSILMFCRQEEASAFNQVSWIIIWKWACLLIPCLEWILNITPVFTEIPDHTGR